MPWTAARQASLSIANSWSPPKLVSIESVMLSNHLILCHPLLPPSIFPSVKVFSNESALQINSVQSLSCVHLFATPWIAACQASLSITNSASGSQIIGVSASASVLPMNTQDQSPLGWTGWIALQSKRLSRVFSNTTVQKHQFWGAQLSL